MQLPVCLPEEKSQELSGDNRGRRRGKHSSCVLLKHVPGFPGGSDGPAQQSPPEVDAQRMDAALSPAPRTPLLGDRDAV